MFEAKGLRGLVVFHAPPIGEAVADVDAAKHGAVLRGDPPEDRVLGVGGDALGREGAGGGEVCGDGCEGRGLRGRPLEETRHVGGEGEVALRGAEHKGLM